MKNDVNVLVIGAGPSGSCVSALLHKAGIKVEVVEKEHFPRFVIGESLLPFCNSMLKEAELFDVVKKHGFQFKNGAAFSWGDKYRYFDFCDKSTCGDGTTFQVQRGDFDKILIDEAIRQGVKVTFDVAVENVEFSSQGCITTLSNGKTIVSDYIVDASGYGRVLPRLLDLESESSLLPRKAFFTHIQDNITESLYDRKKILIITHPDFRDVWFWLIPFSNGRCSIGVVGEAKTIQIDGLSDKEILQQHTFRAPMLRRLLKDAVWDMDVRSISSYSKNVKKLYGERFILLGNASEFLDPVFSSGVTIALYSAKLCADVLVDIFGGKKVDLEDSYAKPLNIGINAFRTYVNGWYNGTFQDVIYTDNENHDVKRQICSILAGYAWDTDNPYVVKSDSALHALAQYYCKTM